MAHKMTLFAANGDSVSETPGTLWDLLANAGGIDKDLDAQAMTILIEDGASKRAMSLGPALRQLQDDGELQQTIAKLEARASGYTRLATWLKEQLPAELDAEIEPDPEPLDIADPDKPIAVEDLAARE